MLFFVVLFGLMLTDCLFFMVFLFLLFVSFFLIVVFLGGGFIVANRICSKFTNEYTLVFLL